MSQQVHFGHGMHVMDGVLVAQVPDGIEDEALARFKTGLLERVHQAAPRGVVIDVSRVRLLDSASFAILADSARMAAMLGARAVFAGFQPGVVSALMDLDVDASGLTAVLGLEEAMELLRSKAAPEAAEAEEPGDAGDADTDDADSGAEAPAP